jgi:phenylpyruvate tautomerase PptA (4-oxalocrotonate tautomerase family)
MPVAYIDIPSGLSSSAKAQLVNDVAESILHAYPIPDTRVFLREWTPDQTSIDGALAAPFRPVCDFVVPPGLPADGKRMLVSRVSSAVAQACGLSAEVVPLPSGKRVNTRWCCRFSARFRSSKPHLMTSWRSRTRWCSKAWRGSDDSPAER